MKKLDRKARYQHICDIERLFKNAKFTLEELKEFLGKRFFVFRGFDCIYIDLFLGETPKRKHYRMCFMGGNCNFESLPYDQPKIYLEFIDSLKIFLSNKSNDEQMELAL